MVTRLLLALGSALSLACVARAEGFGPSLRFPGPHAPLKLLQLTDIHLGSGEAKDGATLEVRVSRGLLKGPR